jgi:hypothetical protein
MFGSAGCISLGILTLENQMLSLRVVTSLVVCCTIRWVRDDGSAKPKHVVYWHNLRINDVVCKKIYIYCGVSDCVHYHNITRYEGPAK